MKKKAVIVSGYFNPIHKGHLEYINNAKAIADELFVIVNIDHQRAIKWFFRLMKIELYVRRLKRSLKNMVKTMIWRLRTVVIKTTTPY